jgi:hypothetical protein
MVEHGADRVVEDVWIDAVRERPPAGVKLVQVGVVGGEQQR